MQGNWIKVKVQSFVSQVPTGGYTLPTRVIITALRHFCEDVHTQLWSFIAPFTHCSVSLLHLS